MAMEFDTKETSVPEDKVLDDSSSTSSNYDPSKTFLATGSAGVDTYRPIDSYEGLHRYDPSFRWTEDEEKKLVRKVCSCPICCLNLQRLTSNPTD